MSSGGIRDTNSWLRNQMSIVLGFPCDEVADYLLTMEAPEAMREHIESFAGSSPEVDKLMQELAKRVRADQAAKPTAGGLFPLSAVGGASSSRSASTAPSGTAATRSSATANTRRGRRQRREGQDDATSTDPSSAPAGYSGVPKPARFRGGKHSAVDSAVRQALVKTTAPKSASDAHADRMAKGLASAGLFSSKPAPQSSGKPKRAAAAKAAAPQPAEPPAAPIPVPKAAPESSPDSKPVSAGPIAGGWSSRVAAGAANHALDLSDAGESIGRKGQGTGVEFSRGPYCPCMATAHGLWTNCMACGKVLCDREAGRVCTACGTQLNHVKPGRKAIMAARKRAEEATTTLGEAIVSEHKRATASGRAGDSTGSAGRAGAGVAFSGASGATAGWEDADEDADFDDDEDGGSADAGAGTGAGVVTDAMRQAIQRKNKLLEFDSSTEARTRVFDDQADYFGGAGLDAGTSSMWLSGAEQSAVHSAEAARRKALHTIRPMTMQLEVDLGTGVVKVSDADAERRANEKEELAQSIRDGAGASVWAAAQDKGAKTAADRIRKQQDEQKRAREIADAGASASGLEVSGARSSGLTGRAAEVYRALLGDAELRRERRLAGVSASPAGARGSVGTVGDAMMAQGRTAAAAASALAATAPAGQVGSSGHPAGGSAHAALPRAGNGGRGIRGFSAAAFGGSSVLQHEDPLDTTGAASALFARRAADSRAKAVSEVVGGGFTSAMTAKGIGYTRPAGDASAVAGLPRQVSGHTVGGVLAVASALQPALAWTVSGDTRRLAAVLQGLEGASETCALDSVLGAGGAVTVAEAADRLTADLEAMAPALEGDGEEDDEAASAAAGSASVTGSGPLSSPYQLITAGSAPPADEGAVGTLRCAVVVSQPDASLLLCGLKRFIGSHWATHHRGRVWIVSGPEEASQAEIDASLAAYRQMLPGRDLPTPAAFPTGCVLGAVDLAETLAMQEYRSRVIDATAPREYSAPNLWRTERPHALRTPIAVPSLEVLSGGGGASASRPAATDKETPLKRLVLLPAATCATATGALEPADLAFRPVETLKPAAVSSSSSSSSVAASASSSESASASAAPASGLVAGGFDISTGTEVGVLSGAAGASVSEAMAGLRKALGSASRSLWPRPSRCEELAPGVVLLREMVPLKVQQAVVDAVRALGVSGGGFHTPTYGDGGAMRCKMMCLGHSWNPRFGEYETKRSHHDDAPVPPVPEAFTGLCQTALGLAKATSRSSVGSRETAQYQPSICLCNYYDPRATMGHHQDKHEADSALKAGSPVISVSIGCSAEFSFGNDHPDTAASRLKTVRLNSGDVLVFGGPGRHIFHGVDRILARTKPRGLKIGQGRLNLTFRELE